MSFDVYAVKFFDLVIVPFKHLGTAWGILPIYTSLVLGELYSRKITFGHTVANGFVMLWAGLNWAWHLSVRSRFSITVLPWIVTLGCIGLGVFMIVLGFRRKNKKWCKILGHARFSSYCIIMLYPMQMHLVPWSLTAVEAILIFALPVWFLIYLLGRLMTNLVK